MFRKIADFFKNEMRLNKEYYQELNASPFSLQTQQSQSIAPPHQRQMTFGKQLFDFTTVEGIKAIPENCDLLRSAGRDPVSVMTALGQKSFEYEKAEKIELAVLCLKKLNEIRMSAQMGYRIDDYYELVGLLARSGQIKEAKEAKAKIDQFFKGSYYKNDALIDIAAKQVTQLLAVAKRLETDLVIMDSHGASCPKCAKYQGRVFSLSGHSKMFPKIPREFFRYGGIHEGCGHSFSPYIHGITDPMLDYTLTFQTGVRSKYRKDIVAFSNRPFIDDRLPEDIERALQHEVKRKAEEDQQRYYREHLIEIEAQRGIDKRNYKWLQENLSDICPKSYSGYKRMKNGNTKNFQKLAEKAAELGREI